MSKPSIFFCIFVLVILFLYACKASEEKNLESIAFSPSGKQICNHYDTSADNSDYISGSSCDNDNEHFIQFTLTATYTNDDEEDVTDSSNVTWTVDDENGDSASILSDNVYGRAYLTTKGIFTINAEYSEKASSENEDDIVERANVELTVE